MSRYVKENVKRKLLEETQFRCGYCLTSIEFALDDSNFFQFGEKAHLTPYSDTEDNSFENLITLCPTCHTKFDKNPDKQGSVARLKELKRHWFIASGTYTKLELDCLFALFQKKNFTWIKEESFKTGDGETFTAHSFSTPANQGYLFQNLINKGLVNPVLEKGAFQGNKLVLGPSRPAHDMLVFILTTKGEEFCRNFLS